MKPIKILILAFGLLGMISLFVPMEGYTMFSALRALGIGYVVAVFGGFFAAAAMGALALASPPMMHWQAVISVAGFGGALVRLKVWQGLGNILDQPFPSQMLVLAIIGGIATSIVAMLQPELRTRRG